MYRSLIFLLLSLGVQLGAQEIDHWESVVLEDQDWAYFIGSEEPPADWTSIDFDDSQWPESQGGFGYGDGDDGTILDLQSVYLRRTFYVSNIPLIEALILSVDYDDAFVAFLNGEEIARSGNLPAGTIPHDHEVGNEHEAVLYQGIAPDQVYLENELIQSLLISGLNTLSIQVHNTDSNSSDFSARPFLFAGVSSENQVFSIGDLPEWFTEPVIFTDSNLPIVIIDTEQEIGDDPKITGYMKVIDNGAGIRNYMTDAPNDYDGWIGIETRGQSTQMFPKRSFSVETRNEDGSNNNVSLMGLGEENDWILNAPYTDKSLMRNAISLWLGRQSGHYASPTKYCEVVLNGSYHGVYMLMEKIKVSESRVDIATLTSFDIEGDELTGGYILRRDHDPEQGFTSAYATPESNGNFFPFYEYFDPKGIELSFAQKDYIRSYIESFEWSLKNTNPNDENGYLSFVDLETFVDFSLVQELTKNVDAYRLSTYFHKDKNSNDPRLKMGPIWDFNLGFGNADYCESDLYTGWAYKETGCSAEVPFWWDEFFSDPQFRNLYDCRWNEWRETFLSDANMETVVDSLKNLLDESAARNFDRWPILGQYVWPNSFVGSSYTAEVEFLRIWISNRINWLDNTNLGFCENYVSGISNANHKLAVFPNPSSGQFFIEYFDFPGQVHLELKNSAGITVYNKTVDGDGNGNLHNIDSSQFPKGIYILHLRNEDAFLSRKLILN